MSWAQVDLWKNQQTLALDSHEMLLEVALEQYRRDTPKSRATRHYVQEWRQTTDRGHQPMAICTFCRVTLFRWQDHISKKATNIITRHARECMEVEKLVRKSAEVPGLVRRPEVQVIIDRLLSVPLGEKRVGLMTK